MARKTTTARKATVTALAWFIGFLIFFPILWTILTSFKTEGEASTPSIARTDGSIGGVGRLGPGGSVAAEAEDDVGKRGVHET